jgi:diphthine-ammonia ligase
MYAALWSGGKDSCFALWRARQQGLHVSAIVNIYDNASGRVRFHGVRAELIREQASSLGVELIQRDSDAESFAVTLSMALRELRRRDYLGIVAGDIHLDDVRSWHMKQASDAGLQLVEPLWHQGGAALLRDFVRLGFRAMLTCTADQWSPAIWPGQVIDDKLISSLSAIPGVDINGENGEYHSFVFDGPLFHRPIGLRTGHVRRSNGFSQIDLLLDSQERTATS